MSKESGTEISGADVAKRMAVLRPHLIDDVPLTQVAADADIAIRTARRWVACYRAAGLAGLALAALDGRRYADAIEVGCSIGVLTARLAP